MNFKPTDFKELENIASYDVLVLRDKGKTYGDSWRQRGGVGAFMMLARKWDRIENQAVAKNYDIFAAGYATAEEKEGLLDDIADLRRYLLLVEEHVHSHYVPGEQTFDTGEPQGRGYVNQD